MSGLWLKALTCYNLQNFPKLSVQELEEALSAQRFTPCGAHDREQHGFTPVFEQESLVRKTEDVLWLQLMSQKKLVPGKLVKRMLGERVAELEKEQARKIGKKEKKELKETIIDELLETAQTSESTVTIMIDTKLGRLLIGAAGTKISELVMSKLLRCIDGLEPSRMEFGTSVSKKMGDLLLDEETSEFKTDSSLVLKGPGSPAATVRFGQHSLCSNEIINHMQAGLRPIALEMSWKDRVSFILSDPFSIKKITYLELTTSELESAKPDDAQELIDAILLVQVGELRNVLEGLQFWLGQPEAEAEGNAELKQAA